MIRIFRIAFAGILLAYALCGTAFAEKTFSVNDNNTGVFDQPSVVLNGVVANVAYIGGSTTAGPFTVFFAAVNGGADFSNLLLPRDNTVLPIPPVAIDNTGAGGNSAYFDARHPKITLRSATEAVILFQARPTPADVVYRPYIAQLALTSTSATLNSVRQVTGFPAGDLSTGDIEDISYNLRLTDNTARMAFANKSTIGSASPFQVHFARVGLDNAQVVGTPIRLDNTTLTGSDGSRPVPSVQVDPLGRSHIAWVADDNTFTDAAAVYYALVKESAGVDNVAIGATFLHGGPKRWSHPRILVAGNSIVTVLAGHETLAADGTVTPIAGSILLAQFNPDAVAQTGLPAQYATDTNFFSIRPAILDGDFVLFRPEAFQDAIGRIHLTGYGNNASTAIYYSIAVSAASPFATFITTRTSVGASGSPEFPGTLAGDYTKAAFGILNGKAVVFWSGIVGSNPANRNMDVSTVQAVLDVAPATTNESGCQVVADPRAGEAGRIPGTALLFLPAAALAVRRFSQGIRRKPRRSIAE